MGIITHMMYTELSNINNNGEPEKKKKKNGRHRRSKTSRLCNCKLLSFPIMNTLVIPIRKTVPFFLLLLLLLFLLQNPFRV
jgi:hypothetical protein